MKFMQMLFIGSTLARDLYNNNAEQQSFFVSNITDQNANTTIFAQSICSKQKEVYFMADLAGMPDQGWTNYAIPSIQNFARSFEVSSTMTRFEVLSRCDNNYYWFFNIGIYSQLNSNINTILPALATLPFSSIITFDAFASVRGSLIGYRRANVPVEVVILTDWLFANSGMAPFYADMIKSFGGVKFTCAGVGGSVDYNYLNSLCNNVIKIANYQSITNSIDQLSNLVCNSENSPTVKPTTSAPATPTDAPITIMPTNMPSKTLTFSPTKKPVSTKAPTNYPTKRPVKTKSPTNYPVKSTKRPTNSPTLVV